MTVVATVGTTHPLCFAGLLFAALALAGEGVRPVCVVTGVTAQDGTAVLARQALEPGLIAAQFSALHAAGPAAFHVGALLSAPAVDAVAAGLAEFPGVPVVVDPVLSAGPGGALADDGARRALRSALVARAGLLTPNLDEASALLGREVRDVAAMHQAARDLVAAGAGAVLVKGGHLAGDAVDVLADEHGTHEHRAPRVAGGMRGTGDLLAAAVAARLAQGAGLHEAVEHARRRVREAIARSVAFAGTRVHV